MDGPIKLNRKFIDVQSLISPQSARVTPLKSSLQQRQSKDRIQITTMASTERQLFFPKQLPQLRQKNYRSLSSIAKMTETQNLALKNELSNLDFLCTERDSVMSGARLQKNVDPQLLMRETDKGFQILTARLNRVVYSLGTQKLDALQDYTFTLKPHSGMYCYIYTHCRDTPLYMYVRKQFENSQLMVYYSRIHKNPDYENNQGFSIFSDNGCTFQISYSFKNEIPMRTYGSPSNKQYKKKKKTLDLVKKNPLDFLEEENDPEQQQERKKHHHEYFKNKIEAIISDGRVLKQFMGKIKDIKEKRMKENFLKKQQTRDSQQKQIMRILSSQQLTQFDNLQSMQMWNNSTMQESRLGLNQTKLEFKIQQTLDRKVKIDEDNFKRKIFLLNKREYLRDVKDIESQKAQEQVTQLKRAKEWLKFKIIKTSMTILKIKFMEQKVIKMKEEKRRVSILRIQRIVRRMLQRRGKDFKARQHDQIKKSLCLEGILMNDTISSRASKVLYDVIKNSAERYYLKIKLIKFHMNIQKVQTCIKNYVQKKRGREFAIQQSYQDFMIKLETINQQNQDLAGTSKKKSMISKKAPPPLTNLNSQSDSTKMKHLKFFMIYKEYQFMLDYIKWSVVYNKVMTRANLIVSLKQKIEEMEKVLNLQDTKLQHFNVYQQLVQLKRPTEVHRQGQQMSRTASSHDPNRSEGLKFTNVWNSIQNLKSFQDEDKIQEMSQLLDIDPEIIKNIPSEIQKRPRLLIIPNSDEMWQLFLRIYNIGDLDANYL
eukprot:403357260